MASRAGTFCFAVREWAMHMQIDMLDAQLNKWTDGSIKIEILGQTGHIVLHAAYADKVKAAYEAFHAAYPKTDSLKIVINIEIPQPIGQFVNEG
jgi:hypothetical protein